MRAWCEAEGLELAPGLEGWLALPTARPELQLILPVSRADLELVHYELAPQYQVLIERTALTRYLAEAAEHQLIERRVELSEQSLTAAILREPTRIRGYWGEDELAGLKLRCPRCGAPVRLGA